jgi:hypothetical protein
MPLIMSTTAWQTRLTGSRSRPCWKLSERSIGAGKLGGETLARRSAGLATDSGGTSHRHLARPQACRAEKFGTKFVDPARRKDLRLEARKEKFTRQGFATGIDLFAEVRLGQPAGRQACQRSRPSSLVLQQGLQRGALAVGWCCVVPSLAFQGSRAYAALVQAAAASAALMPVGGQGAGPGCGRHPTTAHPLQLPHIASTLAALPCCDSPKGGTSQAGSVLLPARLAAHPLHYCLPPASPPSVPVPLLHISPPSMPRVDCLPLPPVECLPPSHRPP